MQACLMIFNFNCIGLPTFRRKSSSELAEASIGLSTGVPVCGTHRGKAAVRAHLRAGQRKGDHGSPGILATEGRSNP